LTRTATQSGSLCVRMELELAIRVAVVLP